MESSLIPFNRAAFVGREREYLEQSLRNMHISSDGPFSKKVSALLSGVLGAKKVLLTTSCTDALEMTALLLDLQPGDEVIMPSFTFVSTANAYALRGARPVFVDVRPDTWNLDERLVEHRAIGGGPQLLPRHAGKVEDRHGAGRR
jgi:dTDP-4-amino-4,6-dideoxygalactose transaminase